MNRSFSKIRHIQETNLKLEKRLIKEEFDDEDKFSEIIRMDQEFDEDPTYKRYEKLYLRKKILDQVGGQMGIDASDMGEEEVDALVDMFSMMMDLSKGDIKKQLTPENIMKHRDGVLKTVEDINDMAIEDEEYELSTKLRDYVNKLKDL